MSTLSSASDLPVAIELLALPVAATSADAGAAGYRAAADAPAMLRATLADLACTQAWCAAEARAAMPVAP